MSARFKKLLLVLAIVFGLGLVLAVFVSQVTAMGHYIPSTHLDQDYVIALFWFLGIGVLLLSLPVSFQERRDLVFLWAVRGAVTLVAMLFYENIYTLDAVDYYRQSLPDSFPWGDAGYGHGTENTQALSWLMNHFLPIFDSFHAMKVCYSLFGFLACYLIYRTFEPFCGNSRRGLLYVVFLYPSMIFWSSILGKDPVILFGIALYVFGTVRFIYSFRLVYLIPMAAGVFLAAYFRSWYLAILVLPLVSLGIRGIKRPALRLVFIAVFAVGALYAIRMFAAQFEVGSMGDLVDRTQSVSHSWSTGGSAKFAPNFESITGMLSFAPLGMFTALFRPLPGEVLNPFGTMAGMENLLLIVFLLKNLGRILSHRQKLREPLTAWSLTFITIWAFIYGYVSYQNLGAGSRFRLQILPVMICLLFYLVADEEEPDVRHSRIT